MLAQDEDDSDGIATTCDLKEKLQKKCWDYYHCTRGGRAANPGNGTEWSSIFGLAFASAVTSFDPLQANWDNPCKFLTHLETKFKNVRDRASSAEFKQERDRVPLDKLTGTSLKQADDDGLLDDEENLPDGDQDLPDDEENLPDGDDDELISDDDEERLSDGDDDKLISDDGEENLLDGDEGDLAGGDDMQADSLRGLQGDVDPLQRLVDDTAHADYLYSLCYDIARLVIEFTQHQKDKAHNDDAKLFRRMCFTDKTTASSSDKRITKTASSSSNIGGIRFVPWSRVF